MWRSLAVALIWAAPLWAEVEYFGSLPFPGDRPNLRGLSAIEVSPDGQTFVVASDRGRLFEGAIVRDASGRATGLSVTRLSVLANRAEAKLPQVDRDSEGLAVLPDGSLAISFEGNHRVAVLRGLRGTLQDLPSPRDFNSFGFNSGLEALAADAQGRLYAIPERSGALTRPFPIYSYDQGLWDIAFRLPRDGDFLPVGADFGPDGLLYILERKVQGFGFQSRLRRVDLNRRTAETLFTTDFGRHGNLEGLSVWSDGQGLRLTMVSDDNFSDWFRGELVEYRLTR